MSGSQFTTINGGYDQLAADLGLNDIDGAELSTYWAHLEGDDLASAVVDRFRQFREWMQQSGLLRAYKLKLNYYHNEYRSNPEIPHLSLMTQWGSQGEFQFLSVNHLRSLLKTVLSSIVQNPPGFNCLSTNADADALEATALYQGVLDYYRRDLRLDQKINKAVECGVVCDSAFMMIEWDYFAGTNDNDPVDPGIWKGAPSLTILQMWDVCYDVTKSSWSDLDWIIVRDWVDREKLKAAFPEFKSDIESCRGKAVVIESDSQYEPNRYHYTQTPDMSNDVQVFKFFHRNTAFMPNGRFCMMLENGKLIFESPVGLIYPRLPVERFVPDEQTDILLGYSPINEMLAIQENINSLVSAISSNANNYASQFVVAQQGTQLSPRTLDEGHKLLEYPPGAQPPAGLNLTAIPETLFTHLKDLTQMMQEIPSVSNASRGQAPGANSTGSAMLFLAGQTTANQGNMSANYATFCSNVMTSLLHVLRVFGRTEKTIRIMGKNVASREIVLASALEDFDQVIVEQGNSVMSTPQGRMGFAQQMLQYGNATPQEALQVAQSGNLGPVSDPVRELNNELLSENEWLMNGDQVQVMALDNHEQHIQMHTRLFSTPWLRKPDLAQKLGIANGPAILAGIAAHIQQHMTYLAQNQNASIATTAPQQPGQQPSAPSPALGHRPHPGPPPDPKDAQQGAAQALGTHMPAQPSPPQPPQQAGQPTQPG
jgi:hypothetical protein